MDIYNDFYDKTIPDHQKPTVPNVRLVQSLPVTLSTTTQKTQPPIPLKRHSRYTPSKSPTPTATRHRQPPIQPALSTPRTLSAPSTQSSGTQPYATREPTPRCQVDKYNNKIYYASGNIDNYYKDLCKLESKLVSLRNESTSKLEELQNENSQIICKCNEEYDMLNDEKNKEIENIKREFDLEHKRLMREKLETFDLSHFSNRSEIDNLLLEKSRIEVRFIKNMAELDMLRDTHDELLGKFRVYCGINKLQELKIKESNHTIDTLMTYIRNKDPKFYEKCIKHDTAVEDFRREYILIVIMKTGNVRVYKQQMYTLIYELITNSSNIVNIESWYGFTERIVFRLKGLKQSLITKYNEADYCKPIDVTKLTESFIEIKFCTDNLDLRTPITVRDLDSEIQSYFTKTHLTKLNVTVLQELFVTRTDTFGILSTAEQSKNDMKLKSEHKQQHKSRVYGIDAFTELYAIIRKLYETHPGVQGRYVTRHDAFDKHVKQRFRGYETSL